MTKLPVYILLFFVLSISFGYAQEPPKIDDKEFRKVFDIQKIKHLNYKELYTDCNTVHDLSNNQIKKIVPDEENLDKARVLLLVKVFSIDENINKVGITPDYETVWVHYKGLDGPLNFSLKPPGTE